MHLESDQHWMKMAIDLARRGQGHVEPNPMVGCVLVKDGHVIGTGWHQKFGEAHAEVNALHNAVDARGATAYVTLEPCCHHGKTPPCTAALIEAQLDRVVVATLDPFEKVAGNGVKQLQSAGINVSHGVLEEEARKVNAPYFKRIRIGRPWVIAKWAMTLDGKIATRSGDSQWISNPESRAVVHKIRGRVDAVAVGVGTAIADDPMLTARPAGARTATRVVLDSTGRLPLDSKLVETAHDVPVLVVTGPVADATRMEKLETSGVEILRLESEDRGEFMSAMLDQLAIRGCTNVLFEGGSGVLGTAFDSGLVDEVLCFLATRIIGGDSGLTAVGGLGVAAMSDAIQLEEATVTHLNGDILVSGCVARGSRARN